jgi:dihydroorotate dehydrogenase
MWNAECGITCRIPHFTFRISHSTFRNLRRNHNHGRPIHHYLGLKLKHPVVPSASPLSDGIDKIRRLEDAGASAIVLYSLFEEQIVGESHLLDHYLSYGAESFAEALDYFPEMDSYNVGPTAILT